MQKCIFILILIWVSVSAWGDMTQKLCQNDWSLILLLYYFVLLLLIMTFSSSHASRWRRLRRTWSAPSPSGRTWQKTPSNNLMLSERNMSSRSVWDICVAAVSRGESSPLASTITTTLLSFLHYQWTLGPMEPRGLTSIWNCHVIPPHLFCLIYFSW